MNVLCLRCGLCKMSGANWAASRSYQRKGCKTAVWMLHATACNMILAERLKLRATLPPPPLTNTHTHLQWQKKKLSVCCLCSLASLASQGEPVLSHGENSLWPRSLNSDSVITGSCMTGMSCSWQILPPLYQVKLFGLIDNTGRIIGFIRPSSVVARPWCVEQAQC